MTGDAPAGGHRVVRVLPDVPAIHRAFDYSVPDRMDDRITVGSRVRIDLHGRRVPGWVTAVDVSPPQGVQPKPLARSSGLGPPASVVELAEWAAWRWAGPPSSFLGTASPDRVVRSLPPAAPASAEVASPGGGAVGLVDAALRTGRRVVVRLPPALDAVLLVEELVHRLGPDGMLVVVPSRRRAAAVVGRLRRAGAPVAELPEDWATAAAGGSLVVGTRLAAWAPMPVIRTAVVLDAHDEAHREQRTPTWSAVDVVIERARRDEATVVLVTPCPTVVLSEGASVVAPPRALERRGWPLVEVVDRRADDPRTGLFSERLRVALREVLERPGGRAVCVLNRTGRVPLLACRQCGSLARCARCGASAALVKNGAEEALVCRRCGERRPAVCAVCDATAVRTLRMGVTRAAEELGVLIGHTAVELTAETGGEEAATSAPLVVGTEAALHRLGGADLVCLLDLDQHLLAPRFGAAEESLSLMARAAGLLGPRERGGRLLVQTRLPHHDAVRAAARADPGLLAAAERPLRAALHLPPFGALALLRGPGSGELRRSLDWRDDLTTSSVGPDRWLVRAVDHRHLCDALAATPRPAGARVEVDPVDV